MFVTRTKIATTIMMLSLTCGGVCLTGRASADAGNEGAKSLGEVIGSMFPDGTHHNFGKVRLGTQVQHTFRIVNTSGVPLEIIRMCST